MLLEHNASTEKLHSDWRKRIHSAFPNIDFSQTSDYLSIIKYIDNTPEKFYSDEAFKTYFDFLTDLSNKEPKILSSILIESEPLLNIGNKVLFEINKKLIHDIPYPKDHNELINFIDQEIHYNILKLYESTYYQLSFLISKYHWIKQNKGLEGLDLWNTVMELKKVGFEFATHGYIHNIRNGIGHGKIVFTDTMIRYIDKNGNNSEIEIKKIISAFDRTLDITTGFSLALKVFYFTNPDYLEKYNIQIPQSILIEELQSKSNAPAWKIINCIEGIAIMQERKKQLIIYIENNNWSYNKVLWYCFTTAYWAERLTKSYQRIFIHLNSKNSKFSTGWAAFDAEKLRQLRISETKSIEEYKDAIEYGGVMFISKIKWPNFIYKIGTFLSIIKTNWPLFISENFSSLFSKSFDIRSARIHSKKFYTVIENVCLVIQSASNNDIESLIRKYHKKIIKKSIRYSCKKCSWFSKTRWLPVKYIRVFIYDTDKRIRDLSGLSPKVVCTIEVNTAQLTSPDIFNSTIEQIGKYRIAWYNKWQGKKLNNRLAR